MDGRRSPSQLSCDLHPADHVPRGRYPSGLFTVCPGLPPGHSFRQGWRFLGTEHRSIPLPAGERFSPFGAVFGWIHWQALSCFGPFVVTLLTVPAFLGDRRVWSATRSRLSPGQELPTPARLNEPPWALNPLDGIFTRFVSPRPPSPWGEEGMSLSPRLPRHGASSRRLCHRIECRDYSDGRCFCDTKAACIDFVRITPTSLPSSTDKRLSPRPALRVGTLEEMVSLYPLACW
jgi:hypothetical protein